MVVRAISARRSTQRAAGAIGGGAHSMPGAGCRAEREEATAGFGERRWCQRQEREWHAATAKDAVPAIKTSSAAGCLSHGSSGNDATGTRDANGENIVHKVSGTERSGVGA